MRRLLLFMMFYFLIFPQLYAQNSQTVTTGNKTQTISFGAAGCNYTWVNSNPAIGLPASGTGDIPPFTATNTTNSQLTATITATPSNSGLAFILSNEGVINVINTSTNKIIYKAKVKYDMYSVAVSPDNRFVYATDVEDNLLITLDAATYKVIATTSTGPIGTPWAVAVSPDGNTIYVANRYNFDITKPCVVNVIDATTYNIKKVINVGADPAGVAVSPNGNTLYVSNQYDNTVSIINLATNAVITIPVGFQPYTILVSHDGNTVYVTADGNVYAINASTNQIVNTVKNTGGALAITANDKYLYSDGENDVITAIDTKKMAIVATMPTQGHLQPTGMSITPDGKKVYVVNALGGTEVINTAKNVIASVINTPVGVNGFGNFITGGIGCNSAPVTYTVNVNPASTIVPTITVTQPTGTITTCVNTLSESPNLLQFKAGGDGLTANLVATASAGFEISIDKSNYSNSIPLTPDNGHIDQTIIWVRSLPATTPGTIPGNVVFTSTGAQTQSVPLSANITAMPTVNQPNNQEPVNGVLNPETDFTGTATSYSWSNNNPAIGLAANGTGNIPAFTAVNTTFSPVTAIITVTPLNSTCNGTPVTFNITVDPSPGIISTSAALTPLTTIYGTASLPESFTISASNLSSGISVSPPAGFEVSADGATFNSTATVNGTGNIAAAQVYVRLAAATHVNSYNGNITLSAGNASDVTVSIPASIVTPAQLTIKPDDKTKPFGAANPPLTVTYTGFVNSDGPAQLTALPNVSTTATTSSPVGQYAITVSNAASPDYTFTYLSGLLTIAPSLSLLNIPNTFTPNGDGINDNWTIQFLDYYPKCTVQIFNRWGQRVFSSVGYTVPWDGKYNGKLLPPATYYYIIDPKNGQAAISGSVTIIR